MCLPLHGYTHHPCVSPSVSKPHTKALTDVCPLPCVPLLFLCMFDTRHMVAHLWQVITLYYRAPELLLGHEQYNFAVDMWSVGCVMAEILNGEPLFVADTEVGNVRSYAFRIQYSWALKPSTLRCPF